MGKRIVIKGADFSAVAVSSEIVDYKAAMSWQKGSISQEKPSEELKDYVIIGTSAGFNNDIVVRVPSYENYGIYIINSVTKEPLTNNGDSWATAECVIPANTPFYLQTAKLPFQDNPIGNVIQDSDAYQAVEITTYSGE